MSDRIDELFRFQQNALALRAERQQVLASNIANADTPNYKARDVDFRSALSDAMGAGAADLSTSSAHHLSAARTGGTQSGHPLLYRIPHQASIDGNTVELDAERAQFADNALRYEAGLSDVNATIKGLLAVIQGN